MLVTIDYMNINLLKKYILQRKCQQGQALLAVVLVMVVALTVALSVAVKTVTNLRTSTEDENSQRAFSAAEAGVEQALTQQNDSPISVSLNNHSNFQTTKSTLSGTSFLARNGAGLLKDEPADIWLSTYPSYTTPFTGNIVISWGSSGESCSGLENANTQSALEIVVISGSVAVPKVAEYVYDPCLSRSNTSNKFTSPITPGSSISGKVFAYKTPPISISSGLIMRIIPLYASTILGVEGSSVLPSQGAIVSSVGISDTAQRKIVSFRGYPKLPLELFPFVMFSPK